MRDEKKLCFSKKMLIGDYAILLCLLAGVVVLDLMGKGVETLGMITAAWIAQLAVSSGFYYWKAKAENILKMPVQLLTSLPDDMRERADPNQIIDAVIGMKD